VATSFIVNEPYYGRGRGFSSSEPVALSSAVMVRFLLTALLVVSCAEQNLAPPPRNTKGECPARPQCETETVCELDAKRGCEVCKCQSPIPK
jgi:hypothetical protein